MVGSGALVVGGGGVGAAPAAAAAAAAAAERTVVHGRVAIAAAAAAGTAPIDSATWFSFLDIERYSVSESSPFASQPTATPLSRLTYKSAEVPLSDPS